MIANLCSVGLFFVAEYCKAGRELVAHWKLCIKPECDICYSGKAIHLSNCQDPNKIIEVIPSLFVDSVPPPSQSPAVSDDEDDGKLASMFYCL